MKGTFLHVDLAETDGQESGCDRVNSRKAIPIDFQEARERLFEDAETARCHVRRRDNHAAGDPRYVRKRPVRVSEMMEDHDDKRDVKGVSVKRKAMAIGLNTRERGLRTGDLEHLPRRIERDHWVRREQKGCESARPGSEVQDAFAGMDATDFDQCTEPEVAIHDVIGADPVIIRRATRIVDCHATWKRRKTYQPAGFEMTIAEFSITPIGKGVSVGEFVARCLDIVDHSGLPYRLNPMGTVVEGALDDVLGIIAQCHKAVAKDCERVSTVIKIDDRKGVAKQLDAKVSAVERRLGRKLKT